MRSYMLSVLSSFSPLARRAPAGGVQTHGGTDVSCNPLQEIVGTPTDLVSVRKSISPLAHRAPANGVCRSGTSRAPLRKSPGTPVDLGSDTKSLATRAPCAGGWWFKVGRPGSHAPPAPAFLVADVTPPPGARSVRGCACLATPLVDLCPC